MNDSGAFVSEGAKVNSRFKKPVDWFGDNFHVEEDTLRAWDIDIAMDIEDLKTPDSVRLNESKIYSAFQLRKERARVRTSEELYFINLIEKTVSTFVANGIVAGGKTLIELINNRNGKVFYLVPPERDQSGLPFDPSKRYEVKLKKNLINRRYQYEFFPAKPSNPITDNELDGLLTQVVE